MRLEQLEAQRDNIASKQYIFLSIANTIGNVIRTGSSHHT